MAIVLKGGTLINGTGAAPIQQSVVVLEGERIGKVGKESDFGSTLTSMGEVIDVSGKTILPGLINAHEHLANRWSLGTYQERAAQDSHYLTLRGVRNALRDLREGITTARDMASRHPINLVLKQGIESGMIVGPRVFTCGQAIAMTGGHGDENAFVADGEEEVRKAARTLLRRGADFIKLMASGGGLHPNRDFPWSSQYTVPEMRAAFDEAHRQGKPCTVHAMPSQAIQWAIEAGVDCVEHASLMDAATAELMARKGIYLVATLVEARVIVERGLELGRPPFLVERLKVALADRIEHFRIAVQAGIRIGAGTDVLGDMARQIAIMVEGGLTPMQAIVASTRTNSEILGKADELGTVTVGKLADVIVVDGDPLADIQVMCKVSLVFKGGQLFRPEILAQATGKAPL